jgi:hypothetical protein
MPSKRGTAYPNAEDAMASAELYIDRDLAPHAEAAEAGAFLVGSYAGQPNFGDYLQLKATMDVHVQIGAHQTLFVMLDAQAGRAYKRSEICLGADGARVLPVYYVLEGMTLAELGLDGLIRLPAPPPSTLLHLYGGGFINDWWGEPAREAVGAVLERHARDTMDGQLRLVMSGLQISPSGEVEAWRPLFAQAEYIGARDEETVRLLKGMLDGAGGKVHYTGDDALAALAVGCVNGARAASGLTIAAHVNLAHYSAGDPDGRLARMTQALATAARHFGAGVTCDLLVAYQSDHVREQEAAERLEACYGRLSNLGEAPALNFRRRNIFDEAVNGTFQLRASFLVTCSYHVALSGLLSHCPTLLLVENDYYRQKAAGLAEAFRTHQFATLEPNAAGAAAVGALLEKRPNRPEGNGSHAMWIGQMDKALALSRACHDMERALARKRLELTAGAFLEVVANLGELRRRRIIEERLAKEVAERAPMTISIPIPTATRGGLAKYMGRSYWRKRRASWVRSIQKRVSKWR